MTIQLDKTTLIQEFNQKSHFASRGIADLEQRLNNRSGDEEQQEAERCILTALYSARAFLSKWLADDSDIITEDALGEEGHYTLELLLSTRRAEGKAKALTMLIHSYVVAMALYHFYTTMGYADAAKRFIEEAQASKKEIITLIHSKTPPTQ